MKHRSVSLAAVLSGVLLLAACGGGGASSSAPSSTAASPAPSSVAASKASGSSPTASTSAKPQASASSAAASPAAEATKLVIGFGAPVAEQMLPAFANDQGIFTKYGLAVTVQQIPNASTVIPSLKSGAIQFAVMASPQPEEGAAAGVPLKWLAMWNPKPDMQICAAPGIASAQDLKGKPVGISAAGATTGVLFIDYLKKAGLDQSAVKLVPLGNVGAQAQAFVSGQIAAFPCAPPLTQSVLAKRKGATVLANLADTYQWNTAGLVGYMPWVTAHASETANVVKALREALTSWKSSPAAAQATIVRVGKVSAQDAKAAYEASVPLVTADITPSVAIEEKVLAVLAQQLPDTKGLKAADMVDSSFTS